MKVLERAVTLNGVEIQLEDWSENNTPEYPDLYGFTIGAYPIAKNNSESGWVKSGDTFRLSIPVNNYRNYTNENVLSDFESLKSGEKTLEDLSEHFSNHKKDMRILGMEV